MDPSSFCNCGRCVKMDLQEESVCCKSFKTLIVSENGEVNLIFIMIVHELQYCQAAVFLRTHSFSSSLTERF